MLKNCNKYIPILVLLLLAASCKQPEQKPHLEKPVDKETMIKVNQMKVKEYADIISAYATRRGWEMIHTKTGLWYMVYQKGNGKKVELNNSVEVSYSIDLLDGTNCYVVDSLQPKTFIVGKGKVESGLEEGILYLREGDKARFIIPPYLAHGLLGDEDKIPRLSIIMYDLTVQKVK